VTNRLRSNQALCSVIELFGENRNMCRILVGKCGIYVAGRNYNALFPSVLEVKMLN
jgi:hypothetical protein